MSRLPVRSFVHVALCLSVLGTSPLRAEPPASKGSPPAEPSNAALTQLSEYLDASGLALLKLREALETQKNSTAQACHRWWTANQSKATNAHKERVFALWAQVAPAQCARALGDALQAQWNALPPEAFVECERNEQYHERLCQALRRLASDAAPSFLSLASSPKIPKSARAVALEQLAELAPTDWLPKITRSGLADPSDPELREPLERALLRRGNADRAAKAELTAWLKRALAQDPLPGPLTLRLWKLLSQLSSELDANLYKNLAARLLNTKDSVPQRVVFARLMGNAPQAKPALHRALVTLYNRVHGPGANSIVLTQALRALSSEQREQFLNRYPTWLSSDPKLAELSWQDAQLPETPKIRASWLRLGLHSIWPEVQSSALGRMQAPCAPKNLRKAARLAGPQSRQGSPDREVRRAAIDALARCDTRKSRRRLRKIADNEAVGAFDRGRALRRYVERAAPNPSNADRVRSIIRRAPNELGRSALFLGLSQLDHAPQYVVDELCLWARSQQPRIAKTSGKKAASALVKLGQRGACPEPVQ